ncbi:hypothetical protein H9P43_004038 [Blastocladiella emersonii ATCC 22665]|nr:hypothetical protein H9P43_004038 [Blastocladiella emersonii ATCC 22665]
MNPLQLARAQCHSNAHFKCAETAEPCTGEKVHRSRSSRRSRSEGPRTGADGGDDARSEYRQSSTGPFDYPYIPDSADAMPVGPDGVPSSSSAAATAAEDDHRAGVGAHRTPEALLSHAITSAVNPSDTINTIQKVQQRNNNNNGGSSSGTSAGMITNGESTTGDASPKAPKKNLREMVDDIIVNTSRYAARQELKPREAPLNLLTTTPKNMTRFVSRTGGVHAFEMGVKDVLSWRNKTMTMLVLSVFTLVCLYPMVVVVAPQVLIIHHMAVGYYEHTKAKAKREAAGKKVSAPKIDMDPTPKLKPAEYRDNMQFIQNSMSQFADAFDAIRNYLNWDLPENATTFLKVVASSTIPAMALFYYVPLNHLVLAVGWLVFVGNTPLVIAMRETLTPVLLEVLNENWVFAKGLVKQWPEVMKVKPKRRSRGANGGGATGSRSNSEVGAPPEEGQYMVAIYENQRWWLGLGFINYLLTSERPAWSDYSGSIPLPPRASYAPPPGFDFLDDDWHVDRQWSVAGPDNDGWVYSDHLWGNPRSAAGVGSLTRRRKWVRRVVRRIDPAEAAAAARAFTANTLSRGGSVVSSMMVTTGSTVGASPAVSSVAPESSVSGPNAVGAVKAGNAAEPPLPPSPPESAAGVGKHASEAEDKQQKRKSRSGSVSSNNTLFRPPTATASAPAVPTMTTGAGAGIPVPVVKSRAAVAVTRSAEDDTASMIISEDEASDADEGAESRDEIEYVLELDGEQIVLEGIRSLDMVDMDRLRDMVRAIKRESVVSSSGASSMRKVRKVRVE